MKFLIIAIFAVVIGMVTFLFGSLLIVSINLSSLLFPFNLLLIPFIGLLTVYLKRRNSKLDGSMKQVLGKTASRGYLPIVIIPFQFCITIITHFAGVSVGREGVAVQLGGVIANNFSRCYYNFDNKLFTKIGMACGFAGLFGTPIAASIFSIEITNREFKKNEFITILIACYISKSTSSMLGLKHFNVNLDYVEANILLFILSLLIFALVGNLFAILLKQAKYSIKKLKNYEYVLVFSFSIFLVVLLYITSGRYTSLGTNLIDLSFYGEIYIYDFIFKSLFTISFIALGYQGGEVTPLFAIGATLGAALAGMFNLPIGILAASGYVFVFANATNSLIASSFLMIEVFSWSIWPYTLVILIVGLYTKKFKNSIYQ